MSRLANKIGLTGKINNFHNELRNTQILQRQLFSFYRSLKDNKVNLPSLSDAGYRVFSQNDEDGLLLYIFSLIGFGNKKCFDVAFGSPNGSNVTNLLCNWGFYGLLVENANLDNAVKFFEQHPDTKFLPPKLISTWVTAENINDLCTDNGLTGEIDLFSLDLDGVDYWVWKNLTAVSPRVFVCEFINYIGADKSLTVPYDDKFDRFQGNPHFFGASLKAFVELSKTKGYRLVGCNKYAFNAFFVKDDLAKDILPEVSVEQCLNNIYAQKQNSIIWSTVKDLSWQVV